MLVFSALEFFYNKTSLTTFIIGTKFDAHDQLYPIVFRFEHFYMRARVPENMPVDSLVATVSAKDPDCQKSPDSDDCRVSYSVRGGDGLGSFYIDDVGNIKTAAVLVSVRHCTE